MINRKTSDISSVNFAEGEVILIDKEPGWTSFDVVKKVRSIVKLKKVGHAGTLDPFATGLLIVCTGRKTKEISSYQEMYKTYSGVISIGKRTDTMDSEGEVIEVKSISGITEEIVVETAKKFLGITRQIPPMYSAKKHKGKSLYKYARKGIEIERAPVDIEIKYFDITEINFPEIEFELKCSKGTYVRVIADDIGKLIGCGAYLKELRRTAIGDYLAKDALRINEFVKMMESFNGHL